MPVYLHGPPVASQICSTSFISRPARSVWANMPLIRLSLATRCSTKSLTTRAIASFLPSRSYSEAVGAAGGGGALAWPPHAARLAARSTVVEIVRVFMGVLPRRGASPRRCRVVAVPYDHRRWSDQCIHCVERPRALDPCRVRPDVAGHGPRPGEPDIHRDRRQHR